MIEMNHVSKTYSTRIKALSDVTLKASTGEFLFIAGPSGSGKSTLLRILFCAERPDRGEVIANEICITRKGFRDVHRLRKTMGVILQDFHLLRDWTVGKNIAFALEITGHAGGGTKRKIEEVLNRVNLLQRLKDPIFSLSAGEQQRVAIARALVNDPPLLLADEPTGNLDRTMAHEVMEILADLNRRGTTIVFATHNMNLVQDYPYRVVHLLGGRVVPPPEHG